MAAPKYVPPSVLLSSGVGEANEISSSSTVPRGPGCRVSRYSPHWTQPPREPSDGDRGHLLEVPRPIRLRVTVSALGPGPGRLPRHRPAFRPWAPAHRAPAPGYGPWSWPAPLGARRPEGSPRPLTPRSMPRRPRSALEGTRPTRGRLRFARRPCRVQIMVPVSGTWPVQRTGELWERLGRKASHRSPERKVQGLHSRHMAVRWSPFPISHIGRQKLRAPARRPWPRPRYEAVESVRRRKAPRSPSGGELSPPRTNRH